MEEGRRPVPQGHGPTVDHALGTGPVVDPGGGHGRHQHEAEGVGHVARGLPAPDQQGQLGLRAGEGQAVQHLGERRVGQQVEALGHVHDSGEAPGRPGERPLPHQGHITECRRAGHLGQDPGQASRGVEPLRRRHAAHAPAVGGGSDHIPAGSLEVVDAHPVVEATQGIHGRSVQLHGYGNGSRTVLGHLDGDRGLHATGRRHDHQGGQQEQPSGHTTNHRLHDRLPDVRRDPEPGGLTTRRSRPPTRRSAARSQLRRGTRWSYHRERPDRPGSPPRPRPRCRQP